MACPNSYNRNDPLDSIQILLPSESVFYVSLGLHIEREFNLLQYENRVIFKKRSIGLMEEISTKQFFSLYIYICTYVYTIHREFQELFSIKLYFNKKIFASTKTVNY